MIPVFAIPSDLFFVAGLPRSGTAWISAVLSLCPDVFCTHEGESKYGDGLLPALSGSGYRYAGDCSPTATQAKYDRVKARRLAVIRSMRDVEKSAHKAFHGLVNQRHITAYRKQLTDWMFRHEPMVITFEKLFTMESAQRIWCHLLPGTHFPSAKVQQMMQLRVQQIIPSRAELLKLSKTLT